MKLKQFNFVPFGELEVGKFYCSNENKFFKILDREQVICRDNNYQNTIKFTGIQVDQSGEPRDETKIIKFGLQGQNLSISNQILVWEILP